MPVDGVAIRPLGDVEIGVAAGGWPFEKANRAAIDAHFAALKAANPALFNGALYMLCDWRMERAIFRGRAVRCDYASFLYWRDTGFADMSVRNCFGSGALFTSDGALILGVMGGHTANAGMIYPPSGSLEDDDVDGGRLDVARNISREILEETGLDIAGREAAGWAVGDDGPRIVLFRRIDLAMTADEAVARIGAHLAAEAKSELCTIHVVRGRGDIVPDRMPPYTQAYIRQAFTA